MAVLTWPSLGDLTPTQGQIRRNAHLRFARYHQHLEDQLDFSLTPLEVGYPD